MGGGTSSLKQEPQAREGKVRKRALNEEEMFLLATKLGICKSGSNIHVSSAAARVDRESITLDEFNQLFPIVIQPYSSSFMCNVVRKRRKHSHRSGGVPQDDQKPDWCSFADVLDVVGQCAVDPDGCMIKFLVDSCVESFLEDRLPYGNAFRKTDQDPCDGTDDFRDESQVGTSKTAKGLSEGTDGRELPPAQRPPTEEDISSICYSIAVFAYLQISFFALPNSSLFELSSADSIKECDFDFQSLTNAAIRAYLHNCAQDSESGETSNNWHRLKNFLVEWIQRNFPNMRSLLVAAARRQLLAAPSSSESSAGPASRKDSYVAIFDPAGEYSLPMRSASVTYGMENSAGWRGSLFLSQSILLTDEMCAMLRAVSPSFSSTAWVRLYATWSLGNSFSRLVHNIISYAGPSILVVRTGNDQLIGACCPEAWKESGSGFFGNTESFLFELSPYFQILPASGKGSNFVYLNSRNKSSPKGIGFGGQCGFHRLFIAEEFAESYMIASDLTYLDGALLESKAESNVEKGEMPFQQYFEAKDIEVWGCGDEGAYRSQKAALATAEMVRHSRRCVDKARLAENQFDREFLLGGTFAKAREAREDVSI